MTRDKSAKQILALLDANNIKSFSQIDRLHNLRPGTASNAARFPVKAGELAIASALGTPAAEIWPSRYHATTGKRLSPQPAGNYPSMQNTAA